MLTVLIGSTGVSYALPPCPADQTQSWHNCFGTMTFASGNKYVGGYKNGERNGQGTFTWANGDKYVGEFKNNKRNGQGTLTFASGNKYVGEFKNDQRSGQGTFTWANGRVKEGIWGNNKFQYARKTPTDRSKVIAKRQPKKSRPKSSRKLGSSGSGFFISKLGHIITNQHVVNKCKRITVGDNAKKQVAANLVETDRRNDLALLRIKNMKMASVETKSLITKLRMTLVPLATEGLLRSKEIELGEDILVAGYPYGKRFSDTIKVTKGIISANRGIGDDTGQFQIDAAVQPGNSGGPIYDENGNIIGVVVSQLNKMKMAKIMGSMPENVNFGIKASTVRQFLNASGLPTKWSKRSKKMTTVELAKIAKNQTVMVMCHR